MRLRQALKILRSRDRLPCRDHTWWKAYRRGQRFVNRGNPVLNRAWWDRRTGRVSYS